MLHEILTKIFHENSCILNKNYEKNIHINMKTY